MYIAICDDNCIFRNQLKTNLIKYKVNQRIQLNIEEYSNGIDLINSTRVYDLIILDYELDDIDGLEAAKILRTKKYLGEIVFLTNYPEFVFDSFEVRPFRFLTKPLNTQKIHDMLDAFIKKIKAFSPIVVMKNNELKTISSKQIIYLEGDGKYCYIRTNEDVYHSSKTLSGVFNELPQHCFYRVHKSYIINLYNIDTIYENYVLLTNGEKALISRKNYAEFKKTYRQFVVDYYVRL